jgi:hypothetical protein
VATNIAASKKALPPWRWAACYPRVIALSKIA